MKDSYSLNIVDRPTVIILANPEGLAINITEILLGNFCRVKIVTENIPAWKKISSHLSDNINFSIDSSNEFKKEPHNYLILISKLFAKIKNQELDNLKESEETTLRQALEILDENSVRGLFVYPEFLQLKYEEIRESLIEKYLQKLPQNSELFFIEQPIGPRMLLSERFLISRYLLNSIFGTKIERPVGNLTLKPVFLGDAARQIVKSILSFNFPGRRIKLSGDPISLEGLEAIIKKYKGGLNINPIEEEWIVSNKFDKEIFVHDSNLEKGIKSAFEWYQNSKPDYLLEKDLEKEVIPETQEVPKAKRITLIKTQKKSSLLKSKNLSRKFATGILLSIIFIILLPIVILFVSFISIYFGQKILLRGNMNLASNLFSISKASSELAGSVFDSYAKIPLTNKVFSSTRDYAQFINSNSRVMVEFNTVLTQSNELLFKIFDNGSYDLNNLSKNISLDLGSLYRETSFLEGEYKDLKGPGAYYVERMVEDLNLTSKRDEIAQIKQLLDNLPDILGEKSPKTYLVLVQNNLELRSTGGLISPIVLLKFDKGRMVDSNILDVNFLDEELKGFVEPPEALKTYLGVENWYLRDSNWDPDFPTTAARAEWFLDKEIDQSVDGVLAVDLKLIQDLVGILNGVEIREFNKFVDKNDLYQIVQSQKDNSKSGESFMVGLTNNVVNKFLSLNPQNKIDLLKMIYQNLNERHFQVFLHNDKAQKIVSDMGWDGSINYPLCARKNCYSDWLAIIEANVGGNRANYFIEREAKLETVVDKNKITRNLTITIKNNANSALGYKANYKNYLRLYVPGKSTFENVIIDQDGENLFLYPNIRDVKGYLEAGIFIEINPGQTKKIKFVWRSDNILNFADEGDYLFYWRKQAGIEELKEDIEIEFPQATNFEQIGLFSLTKPYRINYNTQSSQDFFSRISFKKL